MIRFLYLLLLLLVTACNSGSKKIYLKDTSDTALKTQTSIKNSTYCFLRTEGTAGQDTSAIRLIVEGNKVTGSYFVLPYEKDSRTGTLAGTIQGDSIKAIWTFMQEGIQDTLGVAFKLSGNALHQKPFSVNHETGRQFTSETSQYLIQFNKTNCDKLPSAKKLTP
ncbi:hypothetical protein [Rubrolithibacter danxiaensis]|uniref:hypothetical protein n=1 Tax=Rubrolithibacter danxiaensis TaxID=3390805 RepID=UPI003BF8B3C2